MFDLMKKCLAFGLCFVFIAIASGCAEVSTDAITPKKKAKTEESRKSSGDYPVAPQVVMQTELKALDDKEFKIEDYKGKVVLINLWATWCGPCIVEMPHFVEMQNKYGKDGFQVIGLNSDEEGDEKVRGFVKQQKLNYKIGWATPEITEEFMKISRMGGIPQSLLLNRDGEMTGMFRGGGGDVINSMVESVDKLMAEKK